MPLKIDIDDEVYAALQHSAQPFVDTPNTVLRRVLGIDSNGSAAAPGKDLGGGPIDPAVIAQSVVKKRVAARSRRKSETQGQTEKPPRARRGSLLPESEYELPILQYLDKNGGRAPSREVVDRVGETLADRLTDEDKQTLQSGDVRWKNRAAFVRLRLIEKKELNGQAPRGTWEITEAGRKRLRTGR